MSRIKELLKSDDSILVFDIDGVLALLEFGEYRHYELDDRSWDIKVEAGENFYTEDKVSKKMQAFLKTKDKSKVYVITTVGSNNEYIFKKDFVKKYYDIEAENVYFVEKNIDKLDKLCEIKNKNKDVDNYKIVMIDDTVDILNYIMDNSDFSTVHISSFLDI